MDTHMHNTLSTVESRLNALITSLTTSPTASNAPNAAIALLDADDALTSAVSILRHHQENYARILQLRAEAEKLEERVKGIVREMGGFEREIRSACNEEPSDADSEESDESDSSDSESESESTMHVQTPQTKRRKKTGIKREVDYRLLLDFARRISKYNHEAAADAASGAPRRNIDAIVGLNGDADENPAHPDPVSSVTKNATLWLDESANQTRQVYMLPYPTEERIRMGLMGQIQLAAAEGRPGFDPEKEVERLIREAEGLGAAETLAPVQAGDQALRADEAAKAAAHAGFNAAGGGGGGRGPAPAATPKPKAMLDLDLYDPDDDDF